MAGSRVGYTGGSFCVRRERKWEWLGCSWSLLSPVSSLISIFCLELDPLDYDLSLYFDATVTAVVIIKSSVLFTLRNILNPEINKIIKNDSKL